MKALISHIAEMNRWNGLCGGKQYKVTKLTQADVDEIIQDLLCRLSPENLHCDGEISHAEANRKYRRLMAVVKDLKQFCKANNLNFDLDEAYL